MKRLVVALLALSSLCFAQRGGLRIVIEPPDQATENLMPHMLTLHGQQWNVHEVRRIPYPRHSDSAWTVDRVHHTLWLRASSDDLVEARALVKSIALAAGVSEQDEDGWTKLFDENHNLFVYLLAVTGASGSFPTPK